MQKKLFHWNGTFPHCWTISLKFIIWQCSVNYFFYIFRYALLVGHPPFETATLKETYIRITENRFSIPDWISPQARNLITKCLTHEPELRPSLDNILMDEFFTCGHYPNRLSPYCCTTAPRYQANSSNQNSQRASRCVPQTSQYVLVVLEDSVC